MKNLLPEHNFHIICLSIMPLGTLGIHVYHSKTMCTLHEESLYAQGQFLMNHSFLVHNFHILSHIFISLGFGAQLIGPIQLHVKRQNSSICKFFQDIAWTFFLSVSGKICHSPIKKVKRQPTLIISFSQHSPFFGEQ